MPLVCADCAGLGASIIKVEGIGDKIERFENWFDDLVFRLQCEMEDKKLSVRTLKHSVTQLPSAIRTEHYQFVLAASRDINDAGADIEEIFRHLKLYWTYLEYSLLNRIIQSHASALSTELKQEMKRYTQEIEDFKQQTTVEELIQVGLGCIRREPPPGFSRILTKLEGKVSEYTLAELDKVRRRICFEYNLPTFILMLESVTEGSLHVIYHIPSSELHCVLLTPLLLAQGHISELLDFHVDMSTAFSEYNGKELSFYLHGWRQ